MRYHQSDALRGAAVVLMVVDHLAAVHGGLEWLRGTATRAALPLFCVCAAVLWVWRGVSWRRAGQVAVVGCVVSPVTSAVGLGRPDVLLELAALTLLAPLVVRWPLLAAFVGFVQFTEWPVPWSGYQPGVLLLWASVGVWLSSVPAERWPSLPSGVLQWIGQRALQLYVVHVLGIAAALWIL